MSTVAEKIKAFLDEVSTEAVEERIVEYVIREVRTGRKLTDALKDPYVRNRLSEERLAHVLETPEVMDALEAQIAQSFKSKDFGLLS